MSGFSTVASTKTPVKMKDTSARTAFVCAQQELQASTAKYLSRNTKVSSGPYNIYHYYALGI